MPRPTTKVRRSEGSRGGGRPMGVLGLIPTGGVEDVVGVVGGAGENGGLDMIGASLIGAGRKGGTPRPLSNGGWLVGVDEARGSESAVTGFGVSGTGCAVADAGGAVVGGAAVGVAAVGGATGGVATGGGAAGCGRGVATGGTSSGLRRLNKTLYQTERGAPAYHGVCVTNNILFWLFGRIRILQSPSGGFRRYQRHVQHVNHHRNTDDRDKKIRYRNVCRQRQHPALQQNRASIRTI